MLVRTVFHLVYPQTLTHDFSSRSGWFVSGTEFTFGFQIRIGFTSWKDKLATKKQKKKINWRFEQLVFLSGGLEVLKGMSHAIGPSHA
jgi:hypothetical protein